LICNHQVVSSSLTSGSIFLTAMQSILGSRRFFVLMDGVDSLVFYWR